jgi:hypothetical protein
MQGPKRFSNRLVFALFLLTVSLSQAQGAPTSQPQPVLVANTAAQPVPVTGTVGATQSGAWTVGISGTPTVNVSGSTVVALHDTQVFSPNGVRFFGPIDVSAYKQIRIGVQGQVLTGTQDFQVSLWTITPEGYQILLDRFSGDNLDSKGATKVFDLVDNLYITVFSVSGGPIEVVVWGRSN